MPMLSEEKWDWESFKPMEKDKKQDNGLTVVR